MHCLHPAPIPPRHPATRRVPSAAHVPLVLGPPAATAHPAPPRWKAALPRPAGAAGAGALCVVGRVRIMHSTGHARPRSETRAAPTDCTRFGQFVSLRPVHWNESPRTVLVREPALRWRIECELDRPPPSCAANTACARIAPLSLCNRLIQAGCDSVFRTPSAIRPVSLTLLCDEPSVRHRPPASHGGGRMAAKVCAGFMRGFASSPHFTDLPPAARLAMQHIAGGPHGSRCKSGAAPPL